MITSYYSELAVVRFGHVFSEVFLFSVNNPDVSLPSQALAACAGELINRQGYEDG